MVEFTAHSFKIFRILLGWEGKVDHTWVSFHEKNYRKKKSQKVTKLFSKKKCDFSFFFFQKKNYRKKMSQKVTKLFSKKIYPFFRKCCQKRQKKAKTRFFEKQKVDFSTIKRCNQKKSPVSPEDICLGIKKNIFFLFYGTPLGWLLSILLLHAFSLFFDKRKRGPPQQSVCLGGKKNIFFWNLLIQFFH